MTDNNEKCECIECSNCLQPFMDGDKIIFVRNTFVHERCEKRYRLRLNGLIYRCPVCKGEGIVEGETKKHICTADDCCTFEERSKNDMVTCPLCNGIGAFSKEPKPIIEIVGWEFDD